MIGLDSILRDRLEDTTLLAREFLQCRHFLHTRFKPSLLEFRTLSLAAELQNHSVTTGLENSTGHQAVCKSISRFWVTINYQMPRASYSQSGGWQCQRSRGFPLQQL